MRLVVMPWKDRVAYLRITLATLEEAARGFSDINLVIYNDSSRDWSPEIIRDMTRINVHQKILPISNCHRNYANMISDAFERFDIQELIVQDSDACIHPDFFKVADKASSDFSDLGVLSFFNEDCHPEPVEVVKEVYHRRKHCSFFSCMISRNAWKNYPQPMPGDPMVANCADGDFTTFVHEKSGLSVYSTIRSYAEHIGMQGTHTIVRPGEEIIARARRFYS